MNPLCVSINSIFIKFGCFLKQRTRSNVSVYVSRCQPSVRQLDPPSPAPLCQAASVGADEKGWPHTDRDLGKGGICCHNV